MELVVLTYDRFFDQEFEIVHQMLENGLNTLHLRKPEYSVDETSEYLEKVDAKYHDRIVLHQYAELTSSFNVKGIHLNRRLTWEDYLEVSNKANLQLSASCHSLSEIKQVYDLCNDINYVFLSPIFDSISKQDYKSKFDLNEISLAGYESRNIYALGGVTESNLLTCAQIGFDGVAVLGSIWKSDSPLASFKEIKQQCQQYEKTY